MLTFCTIGFMRIGITRFEVTGGFSEIARSPIVWPRIGRNKERRLIIQLLFLTINIAGSAMKPIVFMCINIHTKRRFDRSKSSNCLPFVYTLSKWSRFRIVRTNFASWRGWCTPGDDFSEQMLRVSITDSGTFQAIRESDSEHNQRILEAIHNGVKQFYRIV